MSLGHVPVELRRLVRERAGGRCEYCLLPEADSLSMHQVDHVLARKHNGKTAVENLALSCVLCNRRKGSDLSSVDLETGVLTPLFHPRRDRWTEHFRVVGLRIVPLTPIGRVTARLLGFNHPKRILERELLRAVGRNWP